MNLSVALLMTLLAQAPTADAPTPPPATAPTAPTATTSAPRTVPLLLVLDVGGDHVPVGDRQGLTEAFSLALSRRLDLEVQSSRSLMDRINFAEQQQQAGCDSSACMAEIANAMGARFVVFSRVVQLGDEQVLRADVYDNVVGRSVALATVQAGSVGELLRRLPTLVDLLVQESHGELPLRAVERPVDVPADKPLSAMARSGLVLGGVGLSAAVVGGGLFAVGLVQRNAINAAAGAYAADPDVDNARALVDARGALNDNTLTFLTCGSACVGAGGLLSLMIGAGVFAVGTSTPAAEPTP